MSLLDVAHSQNKNPNMTQMSDIPIVATSLPPIIMLAGLIAAAAPFFVDEVGEGPPIPPVEVADRSRVSPRLGSAMVGLTIQPFGVVAGHAIGERLEAWAEYADRATPVG